MKKDKKNPNNEFLKLELCGHYCGASKFNQTGVLAPVIILGRRTFFVFHSKLSNPHCFHLTLTGVEFAFFFFLCFDWIKEIFEKKTIIGKGPESCLNTSRKRR